MDNASDQDLISSALAGSSQAFSVLLERHYELIYRIAFKWCGNRADAEDVAQEVCVKLASVLKSFDGRAAFTSWLYRVTLNVVRDMQRGRKRQTAKADALASVAQTEQAADQEMETTASQIWQAVAGLPDKQRDAVMLVHAEGLNHAQAADILDCKESTVSWYVHEAKKALKALL